MCLALLSSNDRLLGKGGRIGPSVVRKVRVGVTLGSTRQSAQVQRRKHTQTPPLQDFPRETIHKSDNHPLAAPRFLDQPSLEFERSCPLVVTPFVRSFLCFSTYAARST